MMTRYGSDISRNMVGAKFRGIINQFYKILPMKEENCPTLMSYMESFQRELLGMGKLLPEVDACSSYIDLVSILQYLISYPCDEDTVRTEVFKAIAITKRIADMLGGDAHG